MSAASNPVLSQPEGFCRGCAILARRSSVRLVFIPDLECAAQLALWMLFAFSWESPERPWLSCRSLDQSFRPSSV